MILADTNILVAAAFSRDDNHHAAVDLLAGTDEAIAVVPTVIAETCYLIESRIGPAAEAAFLDAFEDGDLELVTVETHDLLRMAQLVRQYADLGLGATDASLVAVAERLGIEVIATVDNHFRVVRPRHVAAFTLLP